VRRLNFPWAYVNSEQPAVSPFVTLYITSMATPALPGTGNTAPGLTIATILFFAWAFLTFVVRVWVKAKKSDSWGADDTAITIAAVR